MFPIKIDSFRLGPVLPDVGVDKCFLSVRGSQYFFYSPILVLLSFNSLMYLMTVLSIWRKNKSNIFARQSRVRRTELTTTTLNNEASSNFFLLKHASIFFIKSFCRFDKYCCNINNCYFILYNLPFDNYNLQFLFNKYLLF